MLFCLRCFLFAFCDRRGCGTWVKVCGSPVEVRCVVFVDCLCNCSGVESCLCFCLNARLVLAEIKASSDLVVMRWAINMSWGVA